MKNNILISITLFLAGIFCIVYSLLSISSPQRFTSPDETVNLYFAKLYAETGRIQYYEPLSSLTLGYARPRNATSYHNEIAPQGFTGFYIIYGTIGAFYPQVVPFITPFIGVLGGVFLFLIAKTLYNYKIALLSMILLFILPPYWYWSSMTLYNNIAATTFLVGGLAFFLLGVRKNMLGYYIASGFCFGINHFIRLTDITYFIPFLFLLYYYRRQINYYYLVIGLTCYALSILPAFILNQVLYGNFLSFGYTSNSGIGESGGLISSFISKISFFLLPSGIRIKEILFSLSTYIIGLLPIAFLIGIVEFFSIKKKDTEEKAYIIYYFLLSIWILIYYGSGIFWGLVGFTLDASYIRYFLPLYVLIIPIVAKRLLEFSPRLSLSIICVFVISSIINTYALKGGLSDMQQRRLGADAQNKELLQETEKDSVIFTTLSDKLLFPDRKVIVYGPVYNTVPPYTKVFTYDSFLKIITNLSQINKKIYILNDRGDLDMKKLKSLLEKNKLDIHKSTQNDYLYKVIKV